jgi:tRNA(Ile)-lysidine synthase
MAAAPGGPVGVAVSGGGDSTALLLLLRDLAVAEGRRVEAATVDHGLRAGSAGEAEAVAGLCARLGVAHATLRWQGWDRRGNLQAAARDGRRALLVGWARERGLAAVALGHTLDDQAETFLLRLARGSGVDGLAAMTAQTRVEGVVWLRPLLAVRRAALREWLAEQGVPWAEDPSNADPAFDRVRARAALGPLAGLGLGAERLAETAVRMARARAALDAATSELAAACLEVGAAGDVAIDPEPFARAPEELRLRLTAGALVWVAGARVRPRMETTETAAAAIATRQGLTAHGCVLRPWRGRVAIRREPARVGAPVPTGRIWDGRWEVAGGEGMVGGLGAAGLAARPGWRESGLAREALLTTPGLWRGGGLVAAPVLDPAGAVLARRVAPLQAPWEDSR